MGRSVDEISNYSAAIKVYGNGRKPVLTEQQTAEFRRLMLEPGATQDKVCQVFGVSRGAAYRALKRYPAPPNRE